LPAVGIYLIIARKKTAVMGINSLAAWRRGNRMVGALSGFLGVGADVDQLFCMPWTMQTGVERRFMASVSLARGLDGRNRRLAEEYLTRLCAS
jgi:hypothetical protein